MKYLNGYNEHVLTIVLISLSVFCTKLLFNLREKTKILMRDEYIGAMKN